MAANPTFDGLLDKIRALHHKKNQDYAGDTNPYANFEYVARAVHLSVDKVFEIWIFTKLARLDVLMNDANRDVQNESIEDTMLDLVVYSLLRLSYRMDHPEAEVITFDIDYIPTPESGLGDMVAGMMEDLERAGPPVEFDVVVDGDSVYTDVDTTCQCGATEHDHLSGLQTLEIDIDPVPPVGTTIKLVTAPSAHACAPTLNGYAPDKYDGEPRCMVGWGCCLTGKVHRGDGSPCCVHV